MLRSPAIALVPPPGAAISSTAGPALAGAGVADRWRGGPATTGSVPVSTGQPAAVRAVGGCCTWPLPADSTCAAVARCMFREVTAALCLPAELESDGMLMASELAANTLHAQANIEFDGTDARPIAGAPELRVYLRRAAEGWELAVKVFDSLCGWKDDLVPVPGAAGADAVSGRGLHVVAELSAGRWGHHLTRSRFGGWQVPGKAVWFALPVPGSLVPGALQGARLAPGRAAWALEEMLAERGLGLGLLRAQEPSAGMSVLSVRSGLTVWCRDNLIWWQSPDRRRCERVATDLVEVAEQLVCACAEMDRD